MTTASEKPPTPDRDAQYEQVKLLFEYTKYHLTVYTTLAGLLVAAATTTSASRLELPPPAIWIAIAAIAVAGWAGGVVASSLPHVASLQEFWASKVGPFRTRLFTGEVWTYIEHTAFWFAVAAVVSGAAVGQWRAAHPG